MKELFEKLVSSLSKKIEFENLICNKISDFVYNFSNDSIIYTIRYVDQSVILEKNGNKICEWFFNNRSVNKDIESISDDFSMSIVKKPVIVDNNKPTDNANVPSGNSKSVEFNKMANRVLQFFPDLRNEFESLLGDDNDLPARIDFLKRNVVPRINQMALRKKDENKLSRLFINLCNDYIFGTEQTRCIVTMLFFNGINDHEARAKIKGLLPDYMKKTWEASWRMKKVLTC